MPDILDHNVLTETVFITVFLFVKGERSDSFNVYRPSSASVAFSARLSKLSAFSLYLPQDNIVTNSGGCDAAYLDSLPLILDQRYPAESLQPSSFIRFMLAGKSLSSPVTNFVSQLPST